jgi:cell division protein FtsW
MGFLGTLILMGLFVLLLYRCFVISRTCRIPQGQLLGMGITLVIAFQVLINMGVTVNLFPATGVTLPLISYGGTSVVVTLAMMGIMLNISRYRLLPNRQINETSVQ